MSIINLIASAIQYALGAEAAHIAQSKAYSDASIARDAATAYRQSLHDALQPCKGVRHEMVSLNGVEVTQNDLQRARNAQAQSTKNWLWHKDRLATLASDLEKARLAVLGLSAGKTMLSDGYAGQAVDTVSAAAGRSVAAFLGDDDGIVTLWFLPSDVDPEDMDAQMASAVGVRATRCGLWLLGADESMLTMAESLEAALAEVGHRMQVKASAEDALEAARGVLAAAEAERDRLVAAARPAYDVMTSPSGLMTPDGQATKASAAQARANEAVWRRAWDKSNDAERVVEKARLAVFECQVTVPGYLGGIVAGVEAAAGRPVSSRYDSDVDLDKALLVLWPAGDESAAVSIRHTRWGITLGEAKGGVVFRCVDIDEAIKHAGRRLTVRPALDASASIEDRIVTVLRWLERPVSSSEMSHLLGDGWPSVSYAMREMPETEKVTVAGDAHDFLQGGFYRLRAADGAAPPDDGGEDDDVADEVAADHADAAAAELSAARYAVVVTGAANRAASLAYSAAKLYGRPDVRALREAADAAMRDWSAAMRRIHVAQDAVKPAPDFSGYVRECAA